MPASGPRPCSLRRRRLPYGVFVALGAAALIAAGCRSEAPATTEQTTEPPPPPPTVAPTPTPPDPALGRELQRNGQYEEAIVVYQQVITRSPGTKPLLARLSLARTYFLSGRHLEARREAEALLAEAGSESEQRVGRFLLAEALEALGETEEALDHYRRFAEEGTAVAPYAHLARARLLASLGRSREAAEAADVALMAGLPSVVAAGAMLDIARAFETGGALDDAVLWYQRLLDESDSSADQALARWRIGALSRLRGDPGWADHYLAVIAEWPLAAAALEALADLEREGVGVDGYLAGLVYYRHFRNTEAQDALESYLTQDPPGPRAAEAAYYLAAVFERHGDAEAALDAYADSLRRRPNGRLADSAAWWRARLLEDMGRHGAATDAYEALSAQYPHSSWAPEARFRGGLLLYKQGAYDDAIFTFRGARSLAADSDEVARAGLWLAKAYKAAGRASDAVALLEGLVDDDPDGYYGLRAAALLGRPALSAGPDDVDLTEVPPIDWTAIDAWAGSWLPSPPSGSPQAFRSDPRWLRANELVQLQLLDEASLELESLLETYGGTSRGLYPLVRAFYPLGLTHVSARAASRLLDALPKPAVDAAPPDLLRLAYPIDYPSLIQTTAESTYTSPLLILALIRQESFFDPRAASYAGALGLTQVMPSTFSGGYFWTRSLTLSKPRHHFSTNSLSYSPSLMIILSIPRSRAPSVPGRSCSQISASSAVLVSLGSTTTIFAPIFLASK